MKYFKLSLIMIGRNLRWLWLKLKNRGHFYRAQVNDYEMMLDLSAVGFDIKESNIFKQLALDRTRENEATKILKEFLEPGDVILEAGANIGYYIVMEAKVLCGRGKIFAVEPESRNVELLKKNIELNRVGDMVEVHQLAFGDAESVLPLYVSKNPNLHSFIKPKGDYQTVYIKTTTIDNFMSGKKEKINFIRMDIEGYETKVIKGMNSFLKQNGPLKLFIELHPHRVKAKDMVALLKELQINGFDVYKVISRDSFIRSALGQTTVEDMSITELMYDKRVLQNICALETFFFKK